MRPGWTREIVDLTSEHLFLVGIAMAIAIAISVPTGVLLTRRASLRPWALGFANVMQTIPSLALFGFLIPVPLIGGIGKRTAIVALVLYALLPILRNTMTGILAVDPAVRESAIAMGMTGRELLWQVEIPLAARTIHGGDPHRHGDHYRYGHHCRGDRRRRTGRIHISRNRVGGLHADSGWRHSRFAARADLGRRTRLDRKAIFSFLIAGALLLSSCSREEGTSLSALRISPSRLILGEIIAQHLEAASASAREAQARSRRHVARAASARGGRDRHVSGIHRYRVHRCLEAQMTSRSRGSFSNRCALSIRQLPSRLARPARVRQFVRDGRAR